MRWPRQRFRAAPSSCHLRQRGRRTCRFSAMPLNVFSRDSDRYCTIDIGSFRPDLGMRQTYSFGPISTDQHPAFGFFAGLPGSHGMEPHSLQAWLTVGGGQLLWDDLAAQHGFKPFLAGHTGTNPGVWTNRPMWSAADLSAGPIVLTGLGQDLARKLKFLTLDVPSNELVGALASGRVVAVEWGNPVAALVLGLPQSATHFYTGGIHRNGTAFGLNVRLAAWERLDTAARLAIEDLAAREFMSRSPNRPLMHKSPGKRSPACQNSRSPISLHRSLQRLTRQRLSSFTRSRPAHRMRPAFATATWRSAAD